jgi:heptosyltransferase-2
LEVWLARIPSRIGYARAWRNALLTQAIPARAQRITMHKRSLREIKKLVDQATSSPRSGFTTHSRAVSSPGRWLEPNQYESPGPAHQIYEYLHLVGELGANSQPLPTSLVIPSEETAAAARKFQLQAEPGEDRLLLGLNAGAEYGPAKRWPASRFIAVAQAVQQRKHCRWVILGGHGDGRLASEIIGALARLSPPPINLAGKTSLRELCAVLKLCRVFLTNDTGPMHVATAVGTPVVALFGSTSPALTGPVTNVDSRHTVLTAQAPCSPCFLRTCPIDFRCMLGIGTEPAIQAVIQAAESRG